MVKFQYPMEIEPMTPGSGGVGPTSVPQQLPSVFNQILKLWLQDRRKNLDAMKYDKKSSALSELKAKRQERERRDQERAQKQKMEKGKGEKTFIFFMGTCRH